ncbi:MAG: DUF2953 domain-containing protein [Oscillospiraceae bacterium]|nr:DUF2953 domain-containing protein [Oscillospiraceae bacterium]
MGWLITLGILLLLAVLPLGVRIRYNSEGILVKVIAGPVKITVYPLPGKKKKEKKKKEPKKTAAAQEEDLPRPPQPPKEKKKKAEKTEKGGSLLDFLPLVQAALDFLGDFRRKLRLDNLYLRLIMAANDPCDLAVNYGRAWAAVGNLLPQLEKWFVIKKRDIDVECDFETSKTLVIAHLDLTITLGRLLAAVVKFAVRALIEYLKIRKKRKGGAVK